MQRAHIRLCILILALTCLAAAGCTSVYMKGTPYYEGEYSKPQGPAEDRVNLWPLAYYHDPALSFLWPMGEVTDDHVAVRPLYSAYKLDQEEHEYSVLWPLSDFDFDTKDHRIFPVFWGDDKNDEGYFVFFPLVVVRDDRVGVLPPVTSFNFDTKDYHIFPVFWGDDRKDEGYFVFFPLVWGFGLEHDAAFFDHFTVFPTFWYGRGSHVAAFPLFIRAEDGAGHITRVLWPVLNWRTGDSAQGGSVWPVFGRYVKDAGTESYTYALWPLCHLWGDDRTDSGGRVLLPIYAGAYERDEGWDLVLPLMWRSYDGSSSLLLTPLYYAGRRDEDFWRLLVPLCYQSRTGDDARFITPLLARTRSAGSDTWVVPPLLSGYGHAGDERDLWLLAPLAHRRWDNEHSTSHIFPLYYHDSEDGLFVSAPFIHKSRGLEGYMSVLGPLFTSGWSADDAWRMVFPFFYSGTKGDTSTFVTPLVSRRDTPAGSTWILNPLATWYSEDEKRRDLWVLGPMSHGSWGEGPSSSYIFPLYGYSGEAQRFVTPLCWYSGWDRESSLLLTPLYQEARSGDDVWRLAPPVFYQSRYGDDRTLLTPLLAWSGSKESDTLIAPVLASWLTCRGDERDAWFLGPLAHANWGEGPGASHIFPIYGYDGATDTVISVPISWGRKEGGRFINVAGAVFHCFSDDDSYRWFTLFPFVSGFDNAADKGSWLFPLYYYRRRKADDDLSFGALLPLFFSEFGPDRTQVGVPFVLGYKRTKRRYETKEGGKMAEENKSFTLLPLLLNCESKLTEAAGEEPGVGNKVRSQSKAFMFPLWHHESKEECEEARDESEFEILWRLYDYKHIVTPKEEPGKGQAQGGTRGQEDYVRSRVLWRAMHYESRNGHTTLDLFPFITYDSKAATEFQKISWCWRLFRHERDDKGAVAVDFLFIPVWRSSWW